MKEKDKDLLLLAAVAWFLFVRKAPAVAETARTPVPVTPPVSRGFDKDGNPLPIGRPGQQASQAFDAEGPVGPIEVSPLAPDGN